jgi:hypothetical protein
MKQLSLSGLSLPLIAQPGRIRRGVAVLAGLFLSASDVQAQSVPSYAFSQALGTYTPITAGTVVATTSTSADGLDAEVFTGLPIGFTFQFGGTGYTTFSLSSNGFITFGATPPGSFDSPISSTTAYAGAIAPFGADLVGNLSPANLEGELRYQTLGASPSRTLVVQFSNFQPASSSATLLNFQIRLEEGSNVVQLAYGAFQTEAGLSTNAEVGLRGARNVYNNRTTTTDWTQTAPGSSPTAAMLLTPTVKPPLGLVYTFTPPNSCASPRNLAASNLTDNSAQLTFIEPTPAPAGGYTVTTTPASGGGSQAVSGTPFTLTGLTAGTTYTASLVSNCSGGITSVPATVTFTTVANCTVPTSISISNVGITTADVSFTAGNGNTSFVATATPVAGGNGPVTASGNASPLTLTGLTGGIRYNVTVTGTCTNGTSLTSSPAVDFVTLPANDNPSGALSLTIGTTCTPTNAANIGATPTGPIGYTNPGACGTAANPQDVWFRFTTPATGAAAAGVRITVAGTAAGTVRVFSSAGGAAGPFAPVACSAGSTNNTQAPAFDVPGLTPSTTYYVSVAGFGSNDVEGTFTICVTTPSGCATPVNVVAANVTTTTANINFTPASGAATYTVTYTPTGGSPQTAIGNTSPVALSGLTPSTTYSVTVTSNCGGGQTAASAASSFTTATPPCIAPTNIAANSVTTTAASISFTGGTGATTYTVTYTPAGGSAQTASGATSPIALTGLASSTTYTATVTSNCGGPTATSTTISFTTLTPPPSDLTVASGQNVNASGPYGNITVQAGGTLTLTGATTATGAVTVQGTLITNCQVLSGPGSFTLAAGAELRICATNGIAASGNTGAVQLTGTRSFAADASYVYNGTLAQTTGSGLPATVRNLTVNNVSGLSLSQAVAVRQLARLQAGNLTTAGFGFTLLSVAGQGTAVLDNTGGIVLGTGTMQRAIDNNNSAGIGYRHYSAPVSNTTIGDLAAPGFSPVLNAAYNIAAQPGLVTPFPTVFGYDQNRVTTTVSDMNAFDKGWFSPAITTDAMVPNRGYTANVPNGVLVDFNGTFNNAVQTPGPLTRDAGTDTGWHLLGNPYPAPIDWRTVTAAQRPGLDAAMYVFQSTGQYAGTYRTFLAGVTDPATNSPLVDAGQGYFVRVSAPGTPGTVVLTNANRVTTFDSQPVFGRSTNSLALVKLQIATATQADDALVYFDAAATAGFDSSQDAAKLSNPSGLSLATLAGNETLAINGLPTPSSGETLVPLSLKVPVAGSYKFRVLALPTLAAGGQFYLRDTQTGTQVVLNAGTDHTVQVSAAGTSTGRFVLVYRSGAALATQAGLEASQVSLFPNPAHGQFTLMLPPVVGQTQVEAKLLNALGQVLQIRTITLTSAGATTEYTTSGLAAGIYLLRLETGGASLVRRVVVE